MRANTFSFEITEFNRKLSPYEAHVFIQDQLKLDSNNVVSIGMYGSKVMIKVLTAEILENIFDQWENKLEYTDIEGKSYKVKLCNESSKNLVKIHHVPIELSDRDIKSVLSTYGVVEEIKNDMWKNLPFKCYNDIKLIKMEIHRPIPSYIRIAGKQYWTTYIGQIKTCRRCASTEHEAKNCIFSPENRIRQQRNYASAVNGYTKGQYMLEKERRMEEDFTVLSTQSSKTGEVAAPMIGPIAGNQQNSCTGNRDIDVPEKTQPAEEVTSASENQTEEELNQVQKTISPNPKNLVMCLANKSGNDTDEEGFKVVGGRKRAKSDLGGSESETDKNPNKKTNWVEEMEADDLQGNCEVGPPTDLETIERISRSQSEESSY